MQSVRALRWVALIEAASLLCLGGAMWYRAATGDHFPVRVTGMVHGVLFLVQCWLLVLALVVHRWPLGRIGLLLLASMIPLWPFFLDRRVKAWLAETSAARAARG